jgi:flagellar hook-length control protein FliK
MNMMQNSPLLIAQTSPAKNAMNFKQPNEMAEKPEEGKSFKQVLSKQVEQEASNQDEDKATTKRTESAKAAPADTLGNGSVKEVHADAQRLATKVAAKTIEDVTDASSLALANMMAAIQPNKMGEQRKSIPAERVDNALSLAKQPPTEVDVAVTEKDDAISVKGKVEHPLVERDHLFNSKLANYLGGEKNAKIAQEPSGSQLVSNVAEVSPLSTVATQAANRVLSSPVAAAEQVGFSNLIHAAPGKAGWSEAIGQKVVWMVGSAEQSATLTLNPKDLGPLQVIIHVNNERADATFISENPEVRKALEDGMSNLRQSMGQAGVELGQANVNTNKQQQEFQQSSREQLTHQNAANHAEQLEGDISSSPVVARVSNGLVDTFA